MNVPSSFVELFKGSQLSFGACQLPIHFSAKFQTNITVSAGQFAAIFPTMQFLRFAGAFMRALELPLVHGTEQT
jgi:hypothetical protein